MKRAPAIRHWPLLPLLAGMAVAAAACSNGAHASGPAATTTTLSTAPAGTSDASSRQAALLRFAVCVRAHGVPNFPDPTNGFMSPPPGVDPTQMQSASVACQSLLPNGGSSSVTSPQNLAGLVKFAQCMTKHGIPMSATGNGSVDFGDNADPNSPQFQAASQVCKSLVPDGLP